MFSCTHYVNIMMSSISSNTSPLGHVKSREFHVLYEFCGRRRHLRFYSFREPFHEFDARWINHSHLSERIEHTPVTPFVVIPCNQLHKVVRESNASLGIKYAWPAVSDEVWGHYILLSIAQYAFQLSICCIPVPEA